jgi:hypothetical protein
MRFERDRDGAAVGAAFPPNRETQRIIPKPGDGALFAVALSPAASGAVPDGGTDP